MIHKLAEATNIVFYVDSIESDPIDPSEKWRSSSSTFALFEYKSRTLADVTLDLVRSFGELSLISDIDSFAVSTGGVSLSFSRGETTTVYGAPPKPTPGMQQALKALVPEGMRLELPLTEENSVDMSSPTARRAERLRDDLYGGDPALRTVRTVAMLKPTPKCGPIDVMGRLFTNSNPVYEAQVNKLLVAMLRQYQEQIVTLLAVEQIMSAKEENASQTPTK